MNVIKLAIALGLAWMLSDTSALAKTVHRKPGVAIHHPAQVRSGLPGTGNPASPGTVSAGGYLWNGRSASEAGATEAVCAFRTRIA